MEPLWVRRPWYVLIIVLVGDGDRKPAAILDCFAREITHAAANASESKRPRPDKTISKTTDSLQNTLLHISS